MNVEVPPTYRRAGSMRRRKSTIASLNPSANLDMSPNDVMQKCRQYFRSIDTDGSGKLNQREFKDLIDKISGLNLDEKQLEKAYKRVDQNNDGTITFKEFFDAFQIELICKNGNSCNDTLPPPEKNNQDSKLSSADIMKKCRQYYMSLDKDGDGTMDQKEFKKMIANFGMDLNAKELERAYQKADNNGDGKITFKEFFDAYSSELTAASIAKKQTAPEKTQRRRTSSTSSDTKSASRSSSKSNSRSSSVDLDEVKNDLNTGLNSDPYISDIRSYLQKIGVQNDDTRLQKQQFLAVLKHVEQKTNSQDLKKLFDVIDQSEVDVISLNEFLDLYMQQQYLNSRRRSSNRRRMSSEPPAISIHSIPERPTQNISRTIPEITKNDTKTHHQNVSDNFLAKCRDYFLKQDENGDGKLSIVEFQSMLQRIGLRISPEKIQQIYRKVDKNNDGCISYREFADSYMQTLSPEDKRELASSKERRGSENDLPPEAQNLLSVDRRRNRRYSAIEPQTMRTDEKVEMDSLVSLQIPGQGKRRGSAAVVERRSSRQNLEPKRDLRNRRHSSVETMGNYLTPNLDEMLLATPKRKSSSRRCSANIEQLESQQLLRARARNERRLSVYDSSTEPPKPDEMSSGRKLEHVSGKDMQAYFKCFWNSDKDLDGKLSLVEFSKLIETLGLKLNKRELEKAFIVADANADGLISFNEYLSAYFNKTVLHVLPLDQTVSRLGGNVKSNTDNFFLGKNECYELMRLLGNYLDDERLERFISGVDHKHDNVVRLSKFYHYLGSNI